MKKKAALTLLRLYRKYPGIVQEEWAERIISLMDDPDMGVCLSVTSLVMALVQDQPDQYKGSYVKAAQRLRRTVVDRDVSADYTYYNVPCPWIQVKLLRLLQYYMPAGKGNHVSGTRVYQNRTSADFAILHQRTPMYETLYASPSSKF